MWSWRPFFVDLPICFRDVTLRISIESRTRIHLTSLMQRSHIGWPVRNHLGG